MKPNARPTVSTLAAPAVAILEIHRGRTPDDLDEAVVLAAGSRGGAKRSTTGKAVVNPAEAQVADLAAEGFIDVHLTADGAGAPAGGVPEARRYLQRGAQSRHRPPLTPARRAKCPTRPTEMSDSQAKTRHCGACYGAPVRVSWLRHALVHPGGVRTRTCSPSDQTAPPVERLPNKDHYS